nr:RNA 2',3'-cyclic phosphodiesterase [Geothrix fuzhouensis]
MRLFFALPLPADLRESLARWQQGQAEVEGWTRPEGLHLTLAFLGERPAEALSTLLTVACPIADRHHGFKLWTAGLGGFPTAGTTRVLWLGLESSPALEALATDLRETLATAGEAFDAKPFRAHLTLARWRRARAVARFVPPPPIPFTVDRLVLFESRPRGGYTPLGDWNLRRV